MTRGKDDFSAYEKKNTLQYTGTPCLRTVTKNTPPEKIWCCVETMHSKSCRLPAVFLQKSLFLIKTLCSGMQFDWEIVEYEPGLGGVGEGGVKVL